MARRRLLYTLATLLAAHPAAAQKWMDRYLEQRRPTERAARADVVESTGPGTTLLDAQEVRRAQAVEAPTPEPPRASPVERLDEPAAEVTDEHPIRRAEPVAPEDPRISPEIPELRTAPPEEREPEPPRAEPAPRPAPRPESAEPAEATRHLDPGTEEIRLSPGNAPIPAELAQFAYANGLYARKEYSRAIPEFERYLANFPHGRDRQAALFRLAECYRQSGSRNAARKNYEALVFNFQQGDFIGPASYRLAELCFAEQDYSSAVAFFRKASVWVKDPAVVLSAKFYAARALEKLRFTADAIQAYEDVLSEPGENPFREASQLALVQLFEGSGRRRQALVLLENLRSGSEKPAVQAEATARLGLIHLEQKDYAKAAEELSKAVTLPEIGIWREVSANGLLRALYNQQQYPQTLEAWQRLEPVFSAKSLPEALLITGNTLRQLGKPGEAQAFYDRIAKEFPGSEHAEEAQYQRLVGLYNTGSADLVAEIDAYLSAHPEEGDRRNQLSLMKAEAYYKAGRYDLAAPLYATLQEAGLPADLQSEAIFKFGWCQAQVGNQPGAIQAFSSFLSRYPVHKLAATALAQRAYSYERVRNYKAALADFDDLLRRFPRAKEREFCLQRKALILGQLDDTRGMMEAFRELLKEFPQTAAAGQANYWIGHAAFQARNYAGAIPPLTEARKLDKDFAEKATALLMASKFYLEDRAALSEEVRSASAETKVPTEILRWLGAESLKEQDAAGAEAVLTRLTQGPQEEVTPADWLNLGQAQTRLGKWQQAEEAIRKYLNGETAPYALAAGHLALGQAQLGARQYTEAEASAKKVLELQPEGRMNANGRILSGDIAAARGEHEAAAKLYQSTALVFEDATLTPKALEKAWRAYEKAGDSQQAAKLLNELQTRYPEYPVNLSAATPAR